MIDADRIRDAVTLAAILAACALAWLSVRVAKVMTGRCQDCPERASDRHQTPL